MKTQYIVSSLMLAFCFNAATQAQTKISANGIELPAQWPPRYEVPAKAQDMPVPYLQKNRMLYRLMWADSYLLTIS